MSPRDEAARLEALDRYRALDPALNPAFDRIARLAARVCRAPTALISVVTADRIHVKAKVGTEVRDLPRAGTLCARVIEADDMIVVGDTLARPDIAECALAAADQGTRFYAGMPLVSPDGHRLGVLCVTDTVPRAGLEEAERTALLDLAAMAAEAFAHRRQEEDLRQARDLAEAAQAGLARANQRLRDAIEAIPEGFVLFDADDRYVLWNRKYVEIYPESADLFEVGRSFESALRATVERGEYPGIKGQEEAWFAERLARHRADKGSSEQYRPNGRWVRIEERRTAEGGSVGVHIDITELKARAAEYQRAKETAEAASRAKTEFLAHVSHELRTPLNAILGFSEIIKERLFGPHATDTYVDYARDIHNSAQHLLALVNDVLDLSRIDSGHMRLHEEPLEVGDFIRRCRALVEGQARAAALTLGTEIAPDLPHLVADPLRLRQILLNLLTNAMKFTPSGGRVTIRATRTHDGELALAVADTGTGMTEAEAQRALEPFQQLDPVLSRRYEGAGLGLPIAKALAELHGGRLDIASAPGTGTTVEIRLPAARLVRVDATALPAAG